MKNYLCLISMMILYIGSMKSQNWSSPGQFNFPPTIVWFDSVADRCLVAGNYSWFDSTEIHGFGYLQGDTVIGMGCGFGFDCGAAITNSTLLPKVSGFARYNGELYCTGNFRKAGGVIVNGIAKWDGQDWISIGTGLKLANSSNAAEGFGLETIGNDLYVFGNFDSINSIPANSLAKFDGNTWSQVHGIPRFNPSGTNLIYDIELFQGEFYVGGLFHKNGANPPLTSIAKWDGLDWVAVGNGFQGGNPAVQKLVTFDGKLVIGGHFSTLQNPNSIPGNSIASWDGQVWDTLAGGLKFLSGGGTVSDISIHAQELFVVGDFDAAAGIPMKNIARWDGYRWCGVWYPEIFYTRSIGFNHDTMYINVIQGGIGPDSISKFARWYPSVYGDSCQVMGLLDPADHSLEVALYPNPATASFELSLPSNVPSCNYRILDLAGREIVPERAYHTGNAPIDISGLASAMYLVQVRFKNTIVTKKLIKR